MQHNTRFLDRIIVIIALTVGFTVSGVTASEYPLTFIDDSDNEITMAAPATRIITLYSAHTENLFSLGLDEEVIGVGNVDYYPPQVIDRPRYDYKSDPEKVIAADPDLVLIRPFIKRSRPEFVDALTKAGLNVVSLYPESFTEFDTYIRTLAMLTGTQATAEELLIDFHQEIDAIHQFTSKITPKVTVYFESVEKDYKTVTPDSTAARTIAAAGGLNIAADAAPISQGSSIAAYGAERLLGHADEIDVFVSQRGTMNAGGSVHSISVRPGFYAIKAVAEQRVYVINEKLISSPTFRHVKGVHELARMFYPEVMNDLSAFDTNKTLTNAQMADVAIRFRHTPIFVPTSSYYRAEHKGHTYGTFQDVTVDHSQFDSIETAVGAGYMEYEIRDGKDWFLPENPVTRETFAKIVFMLSDLKSPEKKIDPIQDLGGVSNKKIVEIVVGNGLLECEDGYFHPSRPVTGQEVVETLTRLR